MKGLDFILRLKPVTYYENPEILHHIWGTADTTLRKMDHSAIKKVRFIGFLAQDVEKAAKASGWSFPGIDVPKNDNEVYSLRYSDFIMPIVKSVQEQQEIIDNQNVLLTNQQIEIEKLKDQLIKMQQEIYKLETNKRK